jgi:hypothetical protein
MNHTIALKTLLDGVWVAIPLMPIDRRQAGQRASFAPYRIQEIEKSLLKAAARTVLMAIYKLTTFDLQLV